LGHDGSAVALAFGHLDPGASTWVRLRLPPQATITITTPGLSVTGFQCLPSRSGQAASISACRGWVSRARLTIELAKTPRWLMGRERGSSLIPDVALNCKSGYLLILGR